MGNILNIKLSKVHDRVGLGSYDETFGVNIELGGKTYCYRNLVSEINKQTGEEIADSWEFRMGFTAKAMGARKIREMRDAAAEYMARHGIKELSIRGI